jgi:hypothetical protein
MASYAGNRNDILGMLPQARGRRILVEENQSVGDIISLVSFAHKKNLANYDKIAPSFWTGDVRGTAKKIYDFCKKNVTYIEESETVQTVRSPQRILSEGSGDCKHYASFIGGILDALNRRGCKINWSYRFASYRILDSVPGHVFVVIQDHGSEIWADPVLNSFDYHKPFSYSIDKKISGTLSGCDCRPQLGAIGRIHGHLGATGNAEVKNIGGAIMVAAPAVAWIIPVGTVVAAGLEVVGKLMQIVGGFLNSYKTSTGVRWLTQLYEYYVQGNAGSTSDHHVNEANTLPAQTWFGIALGVPMYDRPRFDALKGIGKSKEQAVMAYMNFPDCKNVPVDAVNHAYDIAQTMNFHDPPGGWKDMHPANIIITSPSGVAPMTASQYPSSITVPSLLSELVPGGSGGASGGFPWVLVLVGGGIFLLMSGKKR